KLKEVEKDVVDWCEKQEISLNTKAKVKLFDIKHWISLKTLFESAQAIMAQVGEAESNDFNVLDRKSTRLNSSHVKISYAVFCLNDPATTENYTLSLHDALPI